MLPREYCTDSGASLLIGHANNGAEIAANSLRAMLRRHARQICGAREVAGARYGRGFLIARPTRLVSQAYRRSEISVIGAAAIADADGDRGGQPKPARLMFMWDVPAYRHRDQRR